MLARKKFGLPHGLLLKWLQFLDSLTVTVEVNIELELARYRSYASSWRARWSAMLSS